MMTSKVRNARTLVLLSALGAAAWACAATDEASPSPPDNSVKYDAGSNEEASQDAAVDADAAPPFCEAGADCDVFPNECGDHTLCRDAIAIDSSTRLLGLWAAADDDIWAAGTKGLVVHYDGAAWKTIPTGVLQTLRSVAGTASNDVWFSSTDRYLLHTRGISADGAADWEVFDSSSSDTPHIMESIWGSAEQGMWGVVDNNYGATGLVLHSNGWQPGVGPAWTLDLAPSWMDPPGPYGGRSLFGFGATEVWSGWLGGRLYRRVDGKWRELNSTTRATLNGMWGSSANDLWLVGTEGTIRRWNGSEMSTLELDPSVRDHDLFGVFGSGPNDVWIVGERSLVLHYDGQHLSRIPVGGLQGARPTLRKVWVSDTSDRIWIVGDAIVLGGKKGALQ